MALSEETKAIIDRLKAEGDLIRNSGTNSVKSVNLKLEKFEGIFNSINTNIAEQTDMMRAQLGLAAEAQERLKTKEQFEEIAPQVAPQTNDSTDDQKPLSEVGNKGGDAIAKMLSLKNLAMIGAGGFVLANVMKGFVEESGGMGAILKDMGIPVEDIKQDWGEFKEDMSLIREDARKVRVFFGKVAKGIEEFVDNPLSIFGLGLGVGALFGLGKDIGGSGADVPGKADAKKRMNLLRGRLLFGAVGLALLAGDEIAKYIGDMVLPSGWETTNYGDFLKGTGAVAEGALLGYSIGRFFGPYGAIAGAVIGAGLAFGNVLSDWITKRNAEKETEFLDRFEEINQILVDSNRPLSEDEKAELQSLADESRNRLRDATSDAARQQIEAAAKIIEDRLLEEVGDKEIGMFGRGDDFDAEMRAAFARFYDPDESGKSAGDESGIRAMAERIGQQYDDGSWLDHLLWGDRNEFIKRSLEGGLSNYFYDSSDPNRIQRLMDTDRMKLIRENFSAQLGEGGRFNSFRSGTTGFQNFGSGEYAILHGKEAVVPFNTAAGQFLNNYFTENWQPKLDSANRTAAVSNFGGMGGAPIVINNTPVVAPQTITTSAGGSTVNVTNASFGGGGGGSASPYNLSGGIN